MKAIVKFVEALLLKMGLANVQVDINNQDLASHNRFAIEMEIPVISLIPFFKRYMDETDPSFNEDVLNHPVGKYLLAANSLKAGPVSLSNFHFTVVVPASHVRLLMRQPELLHEGVNREKLEYVYYRSDLVRKDIVLGMVERGSPFIRYMHDLIQSKLLAQSATMNAVLDKVECNALPQLVTEFFSEEHQINTIIYSEAVPVTVADLIISADWKITSVSMADKYLNHVQRYLSGRVMKRRIYVTFDAQSFIMSDMNGKHELKMSPLLVTEYQLTGAKSAALYRKLVNKSLMQFLTEQVSELQYM